MEQPPINLSQYQLYCQAGALRGKRVTVREKMTVGREVTCDVVLDDPKVSRHHGTFSVRNDKLIFQDHKSTNGSFLNGFRIMESEIHLGDVLKIGSSEFAILEESDFRTINFVPGDSNVTNVVNTTSVKVDALADKFAAIFEYYKEHQPETSEAERYELVRTQRLLNGLKTIYSISQTLTRLVPLPELMDQITRKLFDVFAAAENIVVLLWDEEKKKIVPKHVRAREEGKEPAVNISRTVLDRAIKERCTLIANDASADSRLANSDSIIGFAVKSVICAPLVSGDQVLGALYIDHRVHGANYDELDAELVTAFANQCGVAIENAFLCDSLQKHYHQTLQSLVNAIEAKDPYTKGHTQRVSKYTVGTATAFGMTDREVERLRCAAELHDIGKIGIREGIINKSGKLTDTEYHTIKDHVEMGEKILKPITYLQDILPVIRGHHERWDGSGYPDGLKGENCPLGARILAIADAFDAMTSQRSYNKPVTFPDALERIREASGKHFDPRVVEAFEKYVTGHLLQEQPVTTRASAS